MFPRAPQPRSGPRPLRDALRRAADLVVAFATLEDASSPRDHPGDDEGHPHHRPLRAPSRARRPGSVRPRPAACTVAAGARARADARAGADARAPAGERRVAAARRRSRHNADEPPVGGSSK